MGNYISLSSIIPIIHSNNRTSGYYLESEELLYPTITDMMDQLMYQITVVLNWFRLAFTLLYPSVPVRIL